MRDNRQNAKLKKKRLEVLAQCFLRMTGQEKYPDSVFDTKTTDSDQHRITLN